MRRRRRKLRVDTFPFLAVLLCAMGALILFLVVMDRRAKIVARNKALEQARARAQDREKLQTLQKEEVDKQRQELHNFLLAQNDQLRQRLTGVNLDLAGVEQNLANHQARFLALERQIALEKANLVRQQADLAQSQSGLLQADLQEESKKAEWQRVASEIVLLEKTLRELQIRKSQEPGAFSLVPYSGRHGDSRKPIYVECSAHGLIFHPDGKILPANPLDPWQIRAEVERRAGVVFEKIAIPNGPRKQEANAYLLLLVRPEGIANYYRVQAALADDPIDFGYEFVEDSWAFDFGNGKIARPQQQERLATFPVPPFPGVGGAGIRGQEQGGKIRLDQGPGVRAQGSGVGSQEPGGSGNGRKFSQAPGKKWQGEGRLPTGSLALTNPFKPGYLDPLSPQGGNGNAPANTSRKNTLLETLLPEGIKLSQTDPGKVASGTFPAAQGGTHLESSGDVQWKPGQPGQASQSPGGQGSQPMLDLESGNSTSIPEPGQPSQAVNANKDGPEWNEPGMTGEMGQEKNTPGGGSGPKQFGSAPQNRPSPISHLVGNRDYVILIECTADAAILYPPGRRFPLENGSQPLEQYLAPLVQQLIKGRQASVRPGEPPYRPSIRFQVHRDGLGAYFRVYPLVDPLGIPMVRENVE